MSMAALSLAGACSSVSTFNRLTPRDGGVRLVGDGLSYGEGPRRTIDVHAPREAAPGAPLVMFFYGGSWSWGRRQDYRWLGAALAAQGFVTAIPDYRLVPEVRFPDFVVDCANAVAWARKNAERFGADPARTVLIGHSAGAYNALMLALDRKYLGEAQVQGAVGLAGPYDFYPFDVEATISAFGRFPDPQATTLLISGDADDVVRPRNSVTLRDRLIAAGARSDMRLYPGLGHAGILLALSRPLRGRAPALDDVAAFVRKVTA
jgi:acetyl esterase/lipase